MSRSQALWEESRNIPPHTRLSIIPVMSTAPWARWCLSHRRRKIDHHRHRRRGNRSRCPSRSQSHHENRPIMITLMWPKKTERYRRLQRMIKCKHCRSHQENLPTTITVSTTFKCLLASRRQIRSQQHVNYLQKCVILRVMTVVYV